MCSNPPNGLAMRTERHADATYVVSVAGEIDLCTAPPFEAALVDALDAGATRLVVDLSECSFIDSMGLESMIRAHRRLEPGEAPLALVTEQTAVLLALEITQLDSVFGVYPSREAALDGHSA